MADEVVPFGTSTQTSIVGPVSAPAETSPNDVPYTLPGAPQPWLDTPLPSPHELPAVPLPNFTASAPEPAPGGPAPGLPAHTHTGCAWHSSFVQCLLASGVGCMPCGDAGGGVPPEAAGAYDVGMQQAQVQVPVPVSSTLSHALG
ncbi:hypothetical protein WOLCODRAFT_138032 [Wolfiporia cocos MD-104 SS10]|uniref:Uncharacterized protein n=1 Tax=Wolfiporia cocos (strain MD-104) TaxID=742152 RepID=A0A2H3JMG8_WOLCO|nr:hypothetical protein WOLCODRAFT_138032 [Wolfiporia cocos MD-104 SS10]